MLLCFGALSYALPHRALRNNRNEGRQSPPKWVATFNCFRVETAGERKTTKAGGLFDEIERRRSAVPPAVEEGKGSDDSQFDGIARNCPSSSQIPGEELSS